MASRSLVAVGLRLLLYRTRPGAEMRATVDDRALVGLTGADPVRANRLAWMLGTQLAAVGGILIASTVALDAAQLSLLIVSAYTAAIFGRLRSMPLTFVGAIVVGCMESYLAGYLPQNAYLPGLRLAAPGAAAVPVAAAVPARPAARPGPAAGQGSAADCARAPLMFAAADRGVRRGAGHRARRVDLVTYGPIFSARRGRALLRPAGRVRGPDLAVPAQHGGHRRGRAGPTSAPTAQLWALGAAIAVSAVAGALVALPALRLSGVYLALATAAFAVVLDRWIFTLPSFELFGVRISLFDQGSVEVVGPSLFGFQLRHHGRLMVFAAVCLGARLDRGGRAAPQPVRPAADRLARQRGGVRHARRQPAAGQGRWSSRSRPGSPDSAARCTECSSARSPPTSSTSWPGCRSSWSR